MRVLGWMAVAASLVVGLTTPAYGVPTAGSCELSLGSVTSGGNHVQQDITATSVGPRRVHATDRFEDGATRLHSSWTLEPEVPDAIAHYGHVVVGSALYRVFYRTPESEPMSFTRIGGGWDKFTFFEESYYDEGAKPNPAWHRMEYGLRNDGTLFRWRIEEGSSWRAAGSAPGFGAIKTMTLISQTRTYDTFLATTHGGALSTIRIPVASPMKPVVTVVRTSTWQRFESLVAAKCGQDGFLLLGIDKDTSSGFLYAVSHANGTSTVIKSLGKVPGTFDDPTYFAWIPVAWSGTPISGE
jgi:hypothetical protein